MQPFSVRPARFQDSQVLAELCILHAEYEGSLTRGTATAASLGKALFGDSARAIAWVVERESGDGIVGFATASPVFSTWHGEDFLHLDCLFVVEEARGHGGG
jgi:GNAT superfamily N-acetyltransferase